MEPSVLRAPSVAMMQPTFWPWQGYFALAAAAGVFVFLDDFQFQRHSFHQRNRVLLATGEPAWTSLPVSHPRDGAFPALNTAVPVVDQKWRRRTRATLDQSYRRAAFYETVRGPLEAWIEASYASVADMNIAFITMVAGLLEVAPEWRRSSELGATGARSARVLDILRCCNAGTYLAAHGSFEYMADDGVFPVDEIEVVFQDFRPVAYPQRSSEAFVSHLSVLDALFEVGPEETRALIDEGQRAWVPWDEMVATAAATRVAP